MRQFVTYSVMLIGVTLGYFAIKDSNVTFAPNVGTPETLPTKARAHSPKNSQNLTTAKYGKRKASKHESKRHFPTPDAQRPRSGEDEGTSISTDEIESLASIYQNQEGRKSYESESVGSPEELHESQSRSPIPGVKIAAWVRSNQNRIHTEIPDPKVGSGMRVFLNCVELKKKGMSPVDRQDCAQVLAHKESVSKNPTY